MATSLTADLRYGHLTESLKTLHADGVQVDDFAAIAWNPAMRADIVAAILKHRLFTAPEEQILRLLEINERLWKDAAITEETIKAIGDPPDCPASNECGLYCVTLLFETGDPTKTFARNWGACVHTHTSKNTWKWDDLVFTPEGVRQRANAKPRPLGLRWGVCELGRAFRDRKVEDARPEMDRQGIMGMGQELPLIAALHPRWATAMNGESTPFVDAPDMEVAPDARGEFSCAPFLNFGRDDGRVELRAGDIGSQSSHFGSGSLR